MPTYIALLHVWWKREIISTLVFILKTNSVNVPKQPVCPGQVVTTSYALVSANNTEVTG